MDIYLADKLAPLPIVNTNVSPSSYEGLTGRYGPWLAGVNLTISKGGTHLYGQIAEGPEMGPEAELFPKSDTEFFSKTGAQITFVKDTSGKVVKIIVHGTVLFWGEVDLVAPRVQDTKGD